MEGRECQPDFLRGGCPPSTPPASPQHLPHMGEKSSSERVQIALPAWLGVFAGGLAVGKGVPVQFPWGADPLDGAYSPSISYWWGRTVPLRVCRVLPCLWGVVGSRCQGRVPVQFPRGGVFPHPPDGALQGSQPQHLLSTSEMQQGKELL